MKNSTHITVFSNFTRVIALVLCTIMCMVCFIACSEGSKKTEDGQKKDINGGGDAGHDSWESVLDAFLNAIENGDSEALISLIAPMVSDAIKADPYSDDYDMLGYCTGVNKSEFKRFDLSSLKIYDRRILSTENVYEEYENEFAAYSDVEDAVIVVVEIDLEYYGVRLAYNDINGDNPIDEFTFIKQGGEWYLGYGGGELFDVIYDIFWDHAG